MVISSSSSSGASTIFPDEFTQVLATTSDEEHDINYIQRILETKVREEVGQQSDVDNTSNTNNWGNIVLQTLAESLKNRLEKDATILEFTSRLPSTSEKIIIVWINS